jgi:hypothetical protein
MTRNLSVSFGPQTGSPRRRRSPIKIALSRFILAIEQRTCKARPGTRKPSPPDRVHPCAMSERSGRRGRGSQDNRPQSLASPAGFIPLSASAEVPAGSESKSRILRDEILRGSARAPRTAALRAARRATDRAATPDFRPRRFFAEVIWDRWLRLPVFKRAPQRFLSRALRIARASPGGSGCEPRSQAAVIAHRIARDVRSSLGDHAAAANSRVGAGFCSDRCAPRRDAYQKAEDCHACCISRNTLSRKCWDS